MQKSRPAIHATQRAERFQKRTKNSGPTVQKHFMSTEKTSQLSRYTNPDDDTQH
jgi:hypothetical protein